MDAIYRLKITLKHTKPAIWRRFVVRNSITLPKFHRVIQTIMGWEDSHLHEFTSDRAGRYGVIDPDWSEEGLQNEARVKLKTLLTYEKEKLFYDYDFGDSWEHVITLEKIFPTALELSHPECIGGEKACPPEDCGGIPGYYSLLETLNDPEHPEHEDIKEWLGKEFDPDLFDIVAVNQRLSKLK